MPSMIAPTVALAFVLSLRDLCVPCINVFHTIWMLKAHCDKKGKHCEKRNCEYAV